MTVRCKRLVVSPIEMAHPNGFSHVQTRNINVGFAEAAPGACFSVLCCEPKVSVAPEGSCQR